MNIRLIENKVNNIIPDHEIDEFIVSNSKLITQVLRGQIGLKSALGWLNPPDHSSHAIVSEILDIAEEIKTYADAFVVVGVGGSNRAAQSVIEGLGLNNFNAKTRIYYAGNNLSTLYLSDLLKELEGKSVYVNIIAKDFKTLEPGVAFRFFRSYLKSKHGTDYKKRIILTGSYGKDQLSEIAVSQSFRFLEFPKDVGGRFSAFTSVGLLPMAVAGANIQSFIKSAAQTADWLRATPALDNIAVRYASIRYLLSKKGYLVENLAVFEPCLRHYSRWWLQLHSETEGKCKGAVLPILTEYSDDLHAIGQYIQEGGGFLFETLLNIMDRRMPLFIPASDFKDGFDYLKGKSLNDLNDAVYDASKKAHFEGGVPVLEFVADQMDEDVIASLMYINMLSSYLSAALMGVEPFNQNGVESYKENMYRILKDRNNSN